jgi:Heavy metal associated domain 2
MIDYIHALPGRLRLRSALFRRNPERAAALERLLASANGVRSAVVNPLTGSVTIYYDRSRTTSAALLAVLRSQGCPIALVPATDLERCDRKTIAIVRSRPSAANGPAIGHAVARFLLEKAIERSLMAVVAAVL